MKRAAIYVRVSTNEQKQNGLSIVNQIEALNTYCQENNYAVVGLYNDAGHSAHKKYTKRPELLRLIEDVKKDKIDIILFTKIDRWFRSVSDYYEVQTVLDDYKVPWKTIWEDYETETSAGKFKVNIMLSISQAEAERTSERIKSVKAYQKAHHKWLGNHPPKGYIIEDGCYIKDPNLQKGVETFFRTYLSTMSTSAALKAAEAYGYTMSLPHACEILKNPVFCGKQKNGVKTEPYITEEEHQWILEHNSKIRKPKVEGRVYLFSGLLKCSICGCNLLGKTIKRNWADRTVYYKKYVCDSARSSLHRHEHFQVMENKIESILLSNLDSAMEKAYAEVDAINTSQDYVDAQKKKENLEKRLSRLAKLYEFGDIDDQEYSAKRDEIKIEISKIPLEPAVPPEPLPNNWRETYNNLTDDGKREFWVSVIDKAIFDKHNIENPSIFFN